MVINLVYLSPTRPCFSQASFHRPLSKQGLPRTRTIPAMHGAILLTALAYRYLPSERDRVDGCAIIQKRSLHKGKFVMSDRPCFCMQTGFLVLAASFIGSMGLPGMYLAAVTAWSRGCTSR